MTPASVTVVITTPVAADVRATTDAVERYLHTTGFEFRVVVVDEKQLQRSVMEASTGIVVIVDGALPYPVTAIGDAVAMIQSGAAEVVFGARSVSARASFILRSLLVDELPDPTVRLQALSPDAARLLFGEMKLDARWSDLELAYLANKYGLRLERLLVLCPRATRMTEGLRAISAAISIRMIDRKNGYRAPRRCPVCFSTEVWSCAQIDGNVVRACGRCKCRYLNRVVDAGDPPVRRVLRAYPSAEERAASDALDETAHGRSAREKTSRRRLKTLRKHLPPRARVLEVGVRDGSFGLAASREYEYVGIDRSAAPARAARARGIEVYCSSLLEFVNTGPAFDAVTLYHVFESMRDPHDALSRVKELLKPGGILLVSAIDTESLTYLLSERKRAAQNFRTRAILYSRSALIELLERSGFEIASVGPELEYHDHKFIRYRLASRWPAIASVAPALFQFLPDPLLVSSGSIRIVAQRRAGAPLDLRAIRSVETTHAR